VGVNPLGPSRVTGEKGTKGARVPGRGKGKEMRLCWCSLGNGGLCAVKDQGKGNASLKNKKY